MSQVLLATSIWLHALATVVLIGQYVLLGLVYLPAFAQQLGRVDMGALLEQVTRRLRPLMFGSLLVFIVTGIYLMLSDASYTGLGNFGSAWAILMLVKHVLVVVMIGLGAYLDRALIQRLADDATGAALGRLKVVVNAMIVSGVLILLLTAAAQVT